MRKVSIGIIVVAVGGSLGLGAAFGAGMLARRTALTAGPGMVSVNAPAAKSGRIPGMGNS